ncbi:MAG: LacI family DNA-binding transcriptional regulator [Pseudomonadota bacterium]
MSDHKSRATLADVAKQAGVSTMTVSRVVNRDGRVSQSTRDRVNSAIAQLKYAPNLAARTLARGAVQRVCLLYDNPSEAYLGALLLGALEAARTTGVNLVVQQFSTKTPVESLEDQFERDWDALVLPPPISESLGLRRLVAKREIPAAFISRADELSHGYCIGIDDESAASEMTRHLIDLGHRRIGFIHGHPNQVVSALRYRGFRKALKDAGLPANPDWIAQGYFTFDSGVEAGKVILSAETRPTAIFASNDDMASGLIAAASMRNISVPGELSVAGFDDSPIASIVSPSLTTIRQPLQDIASRAVCAVTGGGHIASDQPASDRSAAIDVVPYDLVERRSTAPPVV